MIYNGKHSMKTRRKDALRSATPRAQAVLETRNIRACRSVLSICEPQVCAHTACPRGATVHRPACHRKVPSPTHNLPSGMPATPLNGTVALHQSTSSPAEPAHNRRPTHRAPPPIGWQKLTSESTIRFQNPPTQRPLSLVSLHALPCAVCSYHSEWRSTTSESFICCLHL